MHAAGARILPDDDHQDMSREAVLLEWERKIEEAERRRSRFQRAGEAPMASEANPGDAGPVAASTDHATRVAPSHLRRRAAAETPVAERRTITITRRPVPARRRRSVLESQLAQPDRIALWAFLLGLLLVAVAAGTAHA
jgi:hypothetical protein